MNAFYSVSAQALFIPLASELRSTARGRFWQASHPHNTQKLSLLTKQLVSPEIFQTWNQNGNAREISSQPFYVWNICQRGVLPPGSAVLFHTWKGCQEVSLAFPFWFQVWNISGDTSFVNKQSLCVLCGLNPLQGHHPNNSAIRFLSL